MGDGSALVTKMLDSRNQGLHSLLKILANRRIHSNLSTRTLSFAPTARSIATQGSSAGNSMASTQWITEIPVIEDKHIWLALNQVMKGFHNTQSPNSTRKRLRNWRFFGVSWEIILTRYMLTDSFRYISSCCFAVVLQKISPMMLVTDSGATDHMTCSSKCFTSYTPCHRKITTADGSTTTVLGQGGIYLNNSLMLKNVLHVPKLFANLNSIQKLIQDSDCKVPCFKTFSKLGMEGIHSPNWEGASDVDCYSTRRILWDCNSIRRIFWLFYNLFKGELYILIKRFPIV